MEKSITPGKAQPTGKAVKAAFFLGTFSILVTFLIGAITYRVVLQENRQAHYNYFQEKAQLLKRIGELESKMAPEDSLATMVKAWKELVPKPQDEYLCIVDRNARLIEHTAHPETLGNDASANPLLGDSPSNVRTLGELVRMHLPFAGDYVSSAGEKQIAVFLPVGSRGWVLGLHRSKEAVEQETRKTLYPVIASFLLVGALLLPLSLLLFYGVFRTDQKKLKQSAAELEENENRFRTVFANLDAAVVVHGPDTSILMANRKARELLRLTEDNLLRKRAADPAWRFIYEDGNSIPVEEYPVNRILKSGEVLHEMILGIRYEDREGVTWVLVNGTPIYSPDSNFTEVVLSFMNISETKKATEERDFLFTLSKDLLSISNRDGFFRQINAAWEEVLGWSLEELKARPWLDFVHPEDREATVDAAEILFKKESLMAFENRYQCRDGSYRWFSWNASTSEQTGMIYAVTRDVTDLKAREEDLRNYSNELENRVRDRTQELQKMVNLMAGRENRMAELKKIVAELNKQLRDAGMEPVKKDTITDDGTF